jgi:iron complex outermembrane receptor protein
LGYRRHTDVFDLIRNHPLVYENNHVTESWQAALRRHQQIETNTTLSYGMEGYRDSIESSNLGHHRRDRGAFYGNVDARALHRFSLSAGAREEIFTGGNSQFSPSISGGYWIGEHMKLRASISSAFRLPTYTDLYYSDPANRGNPNLKPESAWNYEGGSQITVRGATLDLTIFHRREKNDIDYVRTTTSSPWQAENINKLNFTGVEASMRMHLGQQQTVSFAYTGLHGAHETLSEEQSKYTFEHPVHFGTAIWQGQLPGKIVARARLNALQRYQSDPYAIAELAVERSFRRVKPFLQLTNITNTGYEEISGVRMPGRGFLVGIELFTSR